MVNYKITSTTTSGAIEVETIEANSEAEALFLLGTDFGVGSYQTGASAFQWAETLWGPKGARENFLDSVRENLASLTVEEL